MTNTKLKFSSLALAASVPYDTVALIRIGLLKTSRYPENIESYRSNTCPNHRIGLQNGQRLRGPWQRILEFGWRPPSWSEPVQLSSSPSSFPRFPRG